MMSDWEQDADRVRQKAHYEPLKILVWGPGDPGAAGSEPAKKAYAKRQQMKAVLQREFPCAEVHFSEDAEMIRLSEGIGGQLRKEALQARTADLILMLDIGRGVDLELDHFIPAYSWFPPKVHVFLPIEHVSTKGLVREILDYLKPHQIEGFTADEYDKCIVASEKVVRPTLNVALDHLLQRFAK